MTEKLDPSRVVLLEGVFIGDIEPNASTLVFRLATESQEPFDLDLHMMLRAVMHCCNIGAVPSLPHDWLVQAAGAHGKAFQEDA